MRGLLIAVAIGTALAIAVGIVLAHLITMGNNFPAM